MGKSSSDTARPTTRVGSPPITARGRFNPHAPDRGTDRPVHRRTELTRLVRPVRHQPSPFLVPGDVVHRFRALALVSPSGNIYYGDEEARYEDLGRRFDQAQAAAHGNNRRSPHLSDGKMVEAAVAANEQYRAAWRTTDARRLQSVVTALPVSHRPDARRLRQRRPSGRAARRRHNARRNHRRARARELRLADLVDLAIEPDLAAFDEASETSEHWG
jgi:hypothetical protein